MKRTVFFALFVCIATLPAFAAEKESAFDRVMRTGVIRCAYAPYDPYVLRDINTGAMSGPVVDIMELFAAEAGLRVEWSEEVGYATFAEGFKNSRYDMYCGVLSVTPQRARVAAFTDPVMFGAIYAWVREDDARFDNDGALNSSALKAGVVDGEIFQAMTRKHFPLAQEVSLPDMTNPDQLMFDLSMGKVDFIVQSPLKVAHYNVHNPGHPLKRVPGVTVEVTTVAFAVSQGEPDFLNFINSVLMQLNVLGHIDRILDEHGMDESVIFRPNLPYVSEGKL